MKPLFPFYGSKWRIAKFYPIPIAGPPIIEPFAGSAGYAVYWGNPNTILYDADPVVCGTWEYLIRVRPEEIMGLPDIALPGDSVDNYTLVPEARYLIGFWLNRGSSVPKKSRTEFSARTEKAQLTWGPRAKSRIIIYLERIRTWKIFNLSYQDVPLRYGTWFVDPPYQEAGSHYRYKLKPGEYPALAEWCRRLNGQVIVCENPNAQWLPFKPFMNIKSTRGFAQEGIWCPL